MRYIYTCGNEDITVWRSANQFNTTVTVYLDNLKDVECKIYEDSKGKYFTYNNHKMYLDDYKRLTIEYLKNKIKNGEHIYADEFCQVMMSVTNVEFLVPMMKVSKFPGLDFVEFSTGNETELTVCKIVDDEYYHIEDNYKIKVVPVEPNPNVSSYWTFYTEDFVNMINRKDIKIL